MSYSRHNESVCFSKSPILRVLPPIITTIDCRNFSRHNGSEVVCMPSTFVQWVLEWCDLHKTYLNAHLHPLMNFACKYLKRVVDSRCSYKKNTSHCTSTPSNIAFDLLNGLHSCWKRRWNGWAFHRHAYSHSISRIFSTSPTYPLESMKL